MYDNVYMRDEADYKLHYVVVLYYVHALFVCACVPPSHLSCGVTFCADP